MYKKVATALVCILATPVYAAGDKIVGAWHIQASRNDGAARPAVMVFHNDGTMQYIATTTIHSNATATPDVFSGRSGGLGTYTRVRGKKNVYEGQTEEFMYDAVGNVKGRFLVDFMFTLSKDENSSMPLLSAEYRFKMTSFQPENLTASDKITGERVELSDNGQLGIATGHRLENQCYFTHNVAPCHDKPVE